MMRTVARAALLSALSLWADEPVQFDSDINSIEHDGYNFRRVYRHTNQDWAVEVSKGGARLRQIVLGWSLLDETMPVSPVGFAKDL